MNRDVMPEISWDDNDRPERDAMIVRLEADELTEADELVAEFADDETVTDAVLVEALSGIFFLESKPSTVPTWRREPMKGAELGGVPRSPEADVIDEITKLVDWQLENGEKW